MCFTASSFSLAAVRTRGNFHCCSRKETAPGAGRPSEAATRKSRQRRWAGIGLGSCFSAILEQSKNRFDLDARRDRTPGSVLGRNKLPVANGFAGVFIEPHAEAANDAYSLGATIGSDQRAQQH